MPNCALILANQVRDVLNLTEDQIVAAGSIYDMVVDVSQMQTPPPPGGTGWTCSDGQTVRPPGMLITRLAMRQRFTVTELLGIMAYVVANPSGIVAMLMQNLNVATFIDLTRSDTIGGIDLLTTIPAVSPYTGYLLTGARASVILSTPPSPQEAYQGV
jgi:hypothetical protein